MQKLWKVFIEFAIFIMDDGGSGSFILCMYQTINNKEKSPVCHSEWRWNGRGDKQKFTERFRDRMQANENERECVCEGEKKNAGKLFEVERKGITFTYYMCEYVLPSLTHDQIRTLPQSTEWRNHNSGITCTDPTCEEEQEHTLLPMH